MPQNNEVYCSSYVEHHVRETPLPKFCLLNLFMARYAPTVLREKKISFCILHVVRLLSN